MATTMMQRTRTATPARWHAALTRALADGVTLFQVAGSGQWIASSGSRPGVAYAVSLTDCECEAALLGGDPVCRHRAALAYQLGYLELDPEPEPPAPAATPATIIPFPSQAERDSRRDGTPAERAVALIERMAALDGDTPCDLPFAA